MTNDPSEMAKKFAAFYANPQSKPAATPAPKPPRATTAIEKTREGEIYRALLRIKNCFPEANDEALWQGLLEFIAHPPQTTSDEHGKRQVLDPIAAAHHQTKAFDLAGQLANSAIKGEGRNTLADKLGHWLVQMPNHAQLTSPTAITASFSRWLGNIPVQQRGAAR